MAITNEATNITTRTALEWRSKRNKITRIGSLLLSNGVRLGLKFPFMIHSLVTKEREKITEIRFHLPVLNGNKFSIGPSYSTLNHLNASIQWVVFLSASIPFIWFDLVVVVNDDTDDDDIIVCVSIFGHKNRFYSFGSDQPTRDGTHWNYALYKEEVHKMSKITIKYPQWIPDFFLPILSSILLVYLKKEILESIRFNAVAFQVLLLSAHMQRTCPQWTICNKSRRLRCEWCDKERSVYISKGRKN